MASLYDRISKGTISVDEITASMERSTSAGGKYFQSMDKQSQTLNGQLSTLSDNFNNFVGNALEPINQMLAEKILPALNNFLQEASEGINNINFDNLLENLNKLLSTIESIGIAFLSWKVGMTIQTVIQAFQKAQIALSLYSLSTNGASVAQGLFNGTLTISEGLVALLTGKITLAQIATGLWQKAQIALNAAMSANPIGLIITLIGLLVAAIVYLWNTNDTFKNAIIGAWEKIKETAMAVWDWIGDLFTKKIPEWIQSVIDWFKNLPYNIGVSIGEMIGHILKFGIDAKNWVDNELPKIINSIIDWFKQLPSNIWNWLKETLNKIIQWITDTKNTVVQKVPEIINSIIDWFKKLPENIKNIGKNIIEGLWNGILSAKDWLLNKVKSFATGILDGMKNALGIHSPSTKFRDLVGRFIPQGVAVGIEADTSKALKAVNEMDKSLINEMNKSVLLNKNGIAVSGINGTVNQILTASAKQDILIQNQLELDGEKVYENQQKVSAKKNLQYAFA